jgi:hypothetical protein
VHKVRMDNPSLSFGFLIFSHAFHGPELYGT